MGWCASWATEILLWTKYLMTSTLFAGWWHWWWQDDENDDCCKDVTRSASPNQLIIRLLPISPSGWISGFCRKNFFLSFPLHLTQIALKTIKISNITFSDFQHLWYIYHNIFSILECFWRLSLSLLLSSFQLSTVTFDLGTINLLDFEHKNLRTDFGKNDKSKSWSCDL